MSSATVLRREKAFGAAPADYRSRLLALLAADAPLPEYERVVADIRAENLPPDVEEKLLADTTVVLRLREEFAHKRKRERELSALYETARDLSSLRDTNQVLTAIVRRARQLVATDIAYISAADDEHDDFYVRATEGVISEDFARIRVPQNVGICGKVVATRSPIYSSGYSTDKAFVHASAIDSATGGEGIVSILGIPLEVDSKVIGVLFVGDRYVRSYSPQETAVLSSLGTFAALAIENARLLEETRRSLASARAANEALHVKAQAIEEAALAHEQLTELIVRGGSIEDLVQRVSRFLAGEACAIDDQHKVVCGHMPAVMASDKLVQALWESERLGRSVRVPHSDGSNSQVAAIVGGSMRLGALVLHRADELTAAEIRTLERSAIVTGIVLLSAERVSQAAYRSVADTVTSLLRGDSDTFAAARSKLLPPNVAMQWPVRVLLVEHGTESPSSTAAAIRSLVTRRDTVYAEINGDIVVVTALANCEEFAQQISDKLEQVFGRKSSVVVSDEIADFASVPRHYQALRHCLKLLRHLGQPGRVAMECSLRPYAVLFKEQDEDSLRRFVVQEVGALLDYDSKRKTQLTKTLLAFLDHGRSLQKTADFLDAHVNTIRQRLDTISQLKEGWADPSRCLDVHIALRLHSLSGAALC